MPADWEDDPQTGMCGMCMDCALYRNETCICEEVRFVTEGGSCGKAQLILRGEANQADSCSFD